MRVIFYEPGSTTDPWLDSLRAFLPGAQVEFWTPGATPADYAVLWAPPQQLLDEQTGLKAIFNVGAGVDRLLSMRLPRDVRIVRLEDAGMAVQMAEYVCHALIRHFREFEAYEEQARSELWNQRVAPRRANFPVGIMGLGVLGQRVAQAVRQFEFPLVGWSRTPQVIDGIRCFAGPAQLPDFLAATRVLVCMLPLTPDTRNILCADSLSRLQAGAYVINVARGGLLAPEDLLALVNSGHLTGATLDVFESEPLRHGHPFWLHPKIRVTPHISAQTLRDASIAQMAGKILALERGETIAGMVDLERGY